MMTEEKILEYLKQNKEKGIAFAFMPEEVKSWCEFNNTDLMVFDGSWLEAGDVAWFDKRYAYCLSEDYEPKPKFVPHWEEFEVNEDGCFRSDGDLPCKWYRWFDFLNTDADRYNNFGGWLYNDGGRQVWTTNASFIDDEGELHAWAGTEDKVKPATPTKVRFWRYAE